MSLAKIMKEDIKNPLISHVLSHFQSQAAVESISFLQNSDKPCENELKSFFDQWPKLYRYLGLND